MKVNNKLYKDKKIQFTAIVAFIYYKLFVYFYITARLVLLLSYYPYSCELLFLNRNFNLKLFCHSFNVTKTCYCNYLNTFGCN